MGSEKLTRSQALKSLPRHVSLPRLLEAEEGDSSVELVLEDPPGKPLSELMEKPMALPEVLMLGAELASALAVLHQHGLFHGEVSPEAVRIQSNGKSVFWNFPLLLVNRLSDRRRKDRETLGLWSCAPFFSPERAQGAPLAPAADVFALGALLCRAGGGAGPSQTSTLEKLNAIATGKWKPEVPSSFPKQVKRLISRMTHPDPLERPHASVVSHCLCVAQRPEPASRGLWEALPIRQRALAALLAAVAVVGGASWYGGERPTTPVLPAPTSPAPLTSEWCGPAAPAAPVAPAPSAPTKVETKPTAAARNTKVRTHSAKKPPRSSGGVFSRLLALVGGK